MYFAGIIAEYDPFHNGHAWQLAAARAHGAKYVAVALSCGLTQRGALPLLPESVRVAAALASGADLVFALPAPYACAGAEAFAQAGVALLSAAGCDGLVFGAETPDPALLTQTAQLLLTQDYRTALRAALANGARSFAAARQAAVQSLCPDSGAAALLDKPNNNLAVEYCKAILSQGAALTPVPLGRQGADHGQALGSGGGPYASASALRRLWAASGPEALTDYLPPSALPFYRQAHAQGMDTDFAAAHLAQLALLRARTTGPDCFAGVRGVSEGLDRRLYAAVQQAVSWEGLVDAMTTVRYPRARMRRLALDAALNYQADALPALPPYLHLLGARREALPLLKNAALPVGHSLAKLARHDHACAKVADAQRSADALGTLCRRTPAPLGERYRQKIIFLPDLLDC
ncbi:MAG: nucleotidyltransferase family protein [Faecalibacterium sp.]